MKLWIIKILTNMVLDIGCCDVRQKVGGCEKQSEGIQQSVCSIIWSIYRSTDINPIISEM